MIDGRTMTAPSKLAATARSPAAFDLAYALSLSGSAPMGGNVHHPGCTGLGRGCGDVFGPLLVHCTESLAADLGQYPHAVHNGIGVLHGCINRIPVSDVREHGFDLTGHTVGPDIMSLVRLAHRDPHPPAGYRESLGDITPHET